MEKTDINHTSIEMYKNSLIYSFTCHKGEVHDADGGLWSGQGGREGVPGEETVAVV